MIRDCPGNPGHYREYTVAELTDLAAKAGFVVSSVGVENYFRPASLRGRIYNRICRMLPHSLRDGITMVLQLAREEFICRG